MKPLFLDSQAGQIFVLHYSSDKPNSTGIIFIPPFGEELNRSRHMISRQAQQLCDQGFDVLVVDLFGTGDSAGTYTDATWDIWKENIRTAISYLKDQGTTDIIFWAMRSGALLATDLLQDDTNCASGLLLWAPVTNGKNFIGQFLRVKLAGELTGKNDNSPGLTTKDLMNELKQGKTLEIAGYDLTASMSNSLSALSLGKMALPADLKVHWLDVTLTPTTEPGPAVQKITSSWQETNNNIQAHSVQDIAFWTLQEPEWAENILAKTNEIMVEAFS